MPGVACKGNFVAFGKFALQALEPARISARQIEAGRRAITRTAGRGGKLWVRLIADTEVTIRPLGVRMGSGKGPVAYKAAEIKAGKVLYEIGGVAETLAKEAMKIAASKMPIKTRFIMLK